jgi:hypothetical protein
LLIIFRIPGMTSSSFCIHRCHPEIEVSRAMWGMNYAHHICSPVFQKWVCLELPCCMTMEAFDTRSQWWGTSSCGAVLQVVKGLSVDPEDSGCWSLGGHWDQWFFWMNPSFFLINGFSGVSSMSSTYHDKEVFWLLISRHSPLCICKYGSYIVTCSFIINGELIFDGVKLVQYTILSWMR